MLVGSLACRGFLEALGSFYGVGFLGSLARLSGLGFLRMLARFLSMGFFSNMARLPCMGFLRRLALNFPTTLNWMDDAGMTEFFFDIKCASWKPFQRASHHPVVC